MTDKATPSLWEVNQGKRLVKRLKKLDVIAGREYPMVHEMLHTRFLAERLDGYREHGKGIDLAMDLAMQDSAARVYPERTGHLGLDLFQLLVFAGANPGGVKRYLDNIITLHFAGLGGEIVGNDELSVPVDDMAPTVAEVEFPSHPGFPSNDPIRENY